MAQRKNKVAKVILDWVIANSLGVAVIGALSLIPFPTSLRGMFVLSLLIGLPIGVAQWVALRQVAPISKLWLFTISAGLFLGLAALNTPTAIRILGFTDDESFLALSVGYLIIGLFIGLAQWVFLRGHFNNSLVWPLSSAIGLGLGLYLVLVSDLINQSGLASIILVVLVYAIATGLAFSLMPGLESKVEINPVDTT